MTKKKLFPGTPLDKKIPKRANTQSVKKENFAYLCGFFDLDKEALLADQNTPWKVFAEKLMEHLIPGFQVNSAGRNAAFSDYSDYDDVCVIEELAALKELYRKGMTGGRIVVNTGALYDFAKGRPAPITQWMTKAQFDDFLQDASEDALYNMAAKLLKKKLGRDYDIRADQLRSRHDKHKAMCKKKFPNFIPDGLWRPFHFEALDKETNPDRYKRKRRVK